LKEDVLVVCFEMRYLIRVERRKQPRWTEDGELPCQGLMYHRSLGMHFHMATQGHSVSLQYLLIKRAHGCVASTHGVQVYVVVWGKVRYHLPALTILTVLVMYF